MPAFDVQGIDISSWNGTMDFVKAKSKCQYAFIRVGYNNFGKDVRCDYNRQAAIANDFPYGLYWYCRPGLDWKQHGDNFVRIAQEYPFQLDMVLDVETTMLNPADTRDWLINLNDYIITKTGNTPMIYTSAGFWDSAVARSEEFIDNKLWVANWTNAPYPLIPKDFQYSNYTHWQWSADGNGKGAEYGSGPDGDPDMDLDRFNGTAAEFNAMYGTHIVEPPAPPVPSKVSVIANVLNVRKSPGGLLVGSVPYGTIFGVIGSANDATGKKWWQVGSGSWVASWWCEDVT